MVDLYINLEPVHLPEDLSFDMTVNNPVFNDVGSHTLPVTVPATRNNLRIFNGIHRIDSDSDPDLLKLQAVLVVGGVTFRGLVNVTEIDMTEGITLNIGVDNSTAYQEWQNKKLPDLQDLHSYSPDFGKSSPVGNIIEGLTRIYKEADSLTQPLAIFPIVVNKEEFGGETFWEMLNAPSGGSLEQPEDLQRIIDNEKTIVAVPRGYGLTPFLRVWYVLEIIFTNAGLTIEGVNPFKDPDNPDLSLLVVLNNIADSCCRGRVEFADLLPDITAQEFLDALWARFGLVYVVDSVNRTARLKLLKDIIADDSQCSLDNLEQSPAHITFKEKQYIVLKPSTSLDGAAPQTERFEDFSRGLSLDNLHVGESVIQWRNNGTPEQPEWDKDERETYWDELEPDPIDPDVPDPIDPDVPDPEEPDPDDREPPEIDDYFRPEQEEEQTESFLAREFESGLWYALDAFNGVASASSTPFFDWDPQSSGLSPLELKSEDECVPVIDVLVSPYKNRYFKGKAPAYLTGARHFYSYIKGAEKEESGSTPLAFMLALNYNGETVGRILPEDKKGRPVTVTGDFVPKLSLLYQFEGGLFDRFWSGYDELLRHANKTVEVTVRLSRVQLMKLDVFKPVMFKGCKFIIDSFSYQLDSRSYIEAEFTLRPLRTSGDYEINRERNIPSLYPKKKQAGR